MIKSEAVSDSRLSSMDLISYIMDCGVRPLDFAVILYQKGTPDLSALDCGWRSASRCYPVTGSRIENYRWIWLRETEGIRQCAVKTSQEVSEALQTFMGSVFDLSREAPVRQLILDEVRADRFCTITRFHHAAADGQSAAAWLAHQSQVAAGLIEPVKDVQPYTRPSLRISRKRTRKSRYSFRGPSDRLYTSGRTPSAFRRWLTLSFVCREMTGWCRSAGGCSYTSYLATCVLELLALWNRRQNLARRFRLGLWFPVNTRRKHDRGFGNGTSRIRLYARFNIDDDFEQKCRLVQRQIFWSWSRGEWVVPLPTWSNRTLRILAPLLRLYLRRPWVDLGTVAFSHVQDWPELEVEGLKNVEAIESVGPLGHSHPLAINGFTRGGRTHLTFTYDPGLLSESELYELTTLFLDIVIKHCKS